MSKVSIDSKDYEITQKQANELITLLKNYELQKPYSIKESKEDLIRIIIEGLIFELTRKTFMNYVEMINDIIGKKTSTK